MDELINLVVQKTGLTPEQAAKAVEVIVTALKDRLPGPIASHLDAIISGGGAGSMEGLENEAGAFVKSKLSSFLGGKT